MPTPLQQFKDHSSETRIFMHRVWFIVAVVVVMMGILLFRYYTLQVVDYQDYATQSDRNRIHAQPIPPTRGLIYDRNGVLLADNRPSFTLAIIKERVQDMEETLALLSELVSISDNDLKKFYDTLAQRRRPFEPLPLKYRLTQEEIARIAVNEHRLDGVEVEAQLVRYYPFGELFAHTVGYVGRINERELGQFTEEEDERYRGTYTIGKIGLEKQYEDTLMGQVGYQNVETNARGRVLKELDRLDPVPGQDIHLYLDAEVQKTAFQALGEQRGSVVAMDVRTGGVIAMVSKPGFDPNLFVTGISVADYSALRDSLDIPLFDRSLQGRYQAGSTLKPMIGLGGLQTGVIDTEYTISDPGYFSLPGEDRRYRDHIAWGHGKNVDLTEAIVESCNTFYYELAHKMGIDALSDFGSRFGLGDRTGIDIPNENRGIWPSREWKRRARGQVWYPGDTVNMGVGQGFVLVTPLQLTVMTATMATRGDLRRPRVANTHWGQDPDTLENSDTLRGQVEVNPAHWDHVHKAMQLVVHSDVGTARRINKDIGYRMAGKTGTAQVISIAQDEKYDEETIEERNRDHALFVGFAPADNPEIAIAVVVENGGHGGETSAPVARQVLDAYFASEQRREFTGNIGR